MNIEISIDKKIEEINNYLHLNNYQNIKKEDYKEETIRKMFDLFINNIIDEKYDDIEYIVALGDYNKINKKWSHDFLRLWAIK
jgi:hypothetical protein